MNVIYFTEMFNNLEKTFDGINETLSANRDEIKDMAYRTQMESEGVVSKEVSRSAEEYIRSEKQRPEQGPELDNDFLDEEDELE